MSLIAKLSLVPPGRVLAPAGIFRKLRIQELARMKSRYHLKLSRGVRSKVS